MRDQKPKATCIECDAPCWRSPSRCASCYQEARRTHRTQTPENRQAYKRAWHLENNRSECIDCGGPCISMKRTGDTRCRPCWLRLRTVPAEERARRAREYSRRYRLVHRKPRKAGLTREERNERRRAYYTAHREKILERNRAYRIEHHEELNARRRKTNRGRWGDHVKMTPAEKRSRNRMRHLAHAKTERLQRREYQRAVLTVGGETINFNTLPPQVREVAVLLKEVRQITHPADKRYSRDRHQGPDDAG